MNKPIIVEYPRDLVLENIVSAQVDVTDEVGAEAAALRLARFIRSNGARLCGPLIQKSDLNGYGQHDQAKIEFIRQSSSPVMPSGVFDFKSLLEVKSCVMVRFHGLASDMSVVYHKLAVFSYEHELSLSGIVYTVHVSEDGNQVAADFFAVTQ